MRLRLVHGLVFGLVMLSFAHVHRASAQTVTQLTDTKTGFATPGAMDDAGSFVIASTSSNQLGDNPEHAFQLMRFDPTTGAATTILTSPDGLPSLPSITDDGASMAFVASANLTGNNPDLSPELFVAGTDGSGVAQLTDESAVNGGSVSQAVYSGDGARIFFVANTDPLGTNPDLFAQIFRIEPNGTGLTQLTNFADATVSSLSVSDDAQRLIFVSPDDLVSGSNPDENGQVFALLADGTGLRQLTTLVDFPASAASVSGNGERIVFQSGADPLGDNPDNQTEIFTLLWDGSGLDQITTTDSLFELGPPAALAPSITDDGGTVVFCSNHYVFPFTNIDSNFEIWRVSSSGGTPQALTGSGFSVGSVVPTVSGDGGRISFYSLAELGSGSNPDGNPELYAMSGSGSGERQLTDTTYAFNESPDISPDGSLVVYVNEVDPVFGNSELFKVDLPDGVPEPVTAFGGGDVASPSVAADDDTVALIYDGEVHLVRIDGGAPSPLTTGEGNSARPRIAADGSVIVFQSSDDLAGGNPDGSSEIFRIAPDGTDLGQLTSADGLDSTRANVSADGTWVVFQSDADLDTTNPDGSTEIFRGRTDGVGGFVALTASSFGPDEDEIVSRSPSLSADGNLVAYESNADPLGTNAEGVFEIFLYDASSDITRQLTESAPGNAVGPSLSGDGTWVYFTSDAEIFEADPDRPASRYRLRIADGFVERVDGLPRGGVGNVLSDFGLAFGGGVAVSDDASRAAFSDIADPTRDNPDYLSEVWLIDLLAPPAIDVSKQTPTVVSWPVNAGPIRYDVIRGDVADLSDGGGFVSLGPVVCVENDSPDDDTVGFEDTEAPVAGQAFFYLYRGTQGLDDGPGSYGRSSGGDEREPDGGDCDA